jgi:DNA polymerase-3 subunit delta
MPEIRGELAAHLRGTLLPLYVLHGDAPLLILEAADAIRAAARRAGYGEREVLTALPGFDWNALAMASQSLSLFSEKKIVELIIPGGKPGVTGAAALVECAKQLSNETLIIITLPTLDWKDEKTAWFTALAAKGGVIRQNTPGFADLPRWLAERLAAQKQEADEEGLGFLAERVEGNLLAAHQEVRKLSLLYPPGKLDARSIRDAVQNVARYRIDDLRDATLAGDLPRMTRMLEGLLQEGEAPPLILWAMTEEIRAIARFKAGLARGVNMDVLGRELRLRGDRIERTRHAAARLSARALQMALASAAGIDRQMKGMDASGSGDLWDAFMQLALCLADTAPVSRAKTALRAARHAA